VSAGNKLRAVSNTPEQPDYLSDHAVRRQIFADIKEFSRGQVIPSLILSGGAFIYAWRTGQVTSFGYGLMFIVYSVLAGLALYVLIAVIRAPLIVYGWHLRNISSLSVRLANSLPELRTNSFSDFRVISEEPSELEFEVWYFYDGALGNEGIYLSASLETNGVRITGSGSNEEDVSVVGHKALAKMAVRCKPAESQPPINSTHIVLSMARYETTAFDSVFYRQFIPYEKTWLRK
jgi:hypothetical protein